MRKARPPQVRIFLTIAANPLPHGTRIVAAAILSVSVRRLSVW
jgi:hypothetical protein